MNTLFTTPEEEVEHLRTHLKEKMERAKGFENRFKDVDHAHEVVRDYRATPIEKVIAWIWQQNTGLVTQARQQVAKLR